MIIINTRGNKLQDIKVFSVIKQTLLAMKGEINSRGSLQCPTFVHGQITETKN